MFVRSARSSPLQRRAAVVVARPGLLLPSPPSSFVATNRHASRSFWGGAFENEYEEKAANRRRSRLRSFLAALEQLPPTAAEPAQVVENALTEHAHDGVFTSREHLDEAIQQIHARLLEMQLPEVSLKLEVAPEKAAAAPATGAMPGAPAAPPTAQQLLEEDEDAPPDELSDEVQAKLVSIRTSAAMEELPPLWDALMRAAATAPATAAAPAAPPGALPLPLALEAASALASGEPWARLRFHLRLATASGDAAPSSSAAASGDALEAVVGVSDAQLVQAAVAALESSVGWTSKVLSSTELLSEAETDRLRQMGSSKLGVGGTLSAELRKKTLTQRLVNTVSGRGRASATPSPMPKPLEEQGSGIGSEDKLFTALSSDASLHRDVTASLFSYHDRLSTRRRRRVNALKFMGAFVAGNILDFTLTNL